MARINSAVSGDRSSAASAVRKEPRACRRLRRSPAVAVTTSMQTASSAAGRRRRTRVRPPACRSRPGRAQRSPPGVATPPAPGDQVVFQRAGTAVIRHGAVNDADGQRRDRTSHGPAFSEVLVSGDAVGVGEVSARRERSDEPIRCCTDPPARPGNGFPASGSRTRLLPGGHRRDTPATTYLAKLLAQPDMHGSIRCGRPAPARAANSGAGGQSTRVGDVKPEKLPELGPLFGEEVSRRRYGAMGRGSLLWLVSGSWRPRARRRAGVGSDARV